MSHNHRSYVFGSNGMKIWLVNAFFILMNVASATSAQVSGKVVLEQMIQAKLDRILTADEYVLDIKIQHSGDNSATNAPKDSFLPGLQVLGPSPENIGNGEVILPGKADVLLIVDKKVSKERARVAQDILNRIVESEGLKASVKVSLQQKDINKIPPVESPPPPAREPSVLEQVIREKEFVARSLLVFWGGIVSLMAIYFVLRRFLFGGAEASGSPRSRAERKGAESFAEQALPAAAAGSNVGKPEKTRESLYSKDEAILNGIKEVTFEAKEQPEKVAKILSRWVAQNADLGRAAAVFLRNCDIKTVEMICKVMHPSDLESIMGYKIDDFEPFGAENQRVIDRIRSDFAVLASEMVLRERPDPLAFMKRLSDDELRNILLGESEITIALVATQLPAHRLQKLYEKTPADALKTIVAQLSSLKSASAKDFDSLQVRLKNKLETIAGNLVSDVDRVNAIHHMVSSVGSPRLQCDLLDRLGTDSQDIYTKVRESLLVATDLRFLPRRVKTLLVQSIDADTMGVALSDFEMSFDGFLEGLPAAYLAVFNDARRRRYDESIVTASWKRVSGVLNELIAAGVISKAEVAGTIRRADAPLAANSEKENQPQNEDLTGAA